MSNWHYNGCPHSRAGILPSLCSECIEPAGSKSRGHNWNVSASSPPFALICLEPETMQPFCSVISWTLGMGGGTSLAVWSHSHYCCTHPADLNKHNHHAAPCLATFLSGPSLRFLPPLMLKINAIYCCPFAKKERRKREKKAGNCTIAMHVL